MNNNPLSLIAKSTEDMIDQIRELAKSDVPEGTHYLQITVTLLKKLIDREPLR